ncbi:fluoride efflux transporter FluC [Halomonas cerina]|uniref:Fluoride-specific ion channel FluC n=1 Tax=Halomonas cerina TaxID=447424 RepID=A0A839VJP4_9GAMM|nr:CrcB family protein [Halomonas cerina]MBB3192606.1 CrcB protein [Halomonas cerina]
MTWGATSLLLVAMGGALGGMARLAVTELMSHWLGHRFPWGTLLANLSGALALGGLAAQMGTVGSTLVWQLLAVGGLGGYTTVSSLSLQTLTLWQAGHRHRAVANMLVTVPAGVGAVALGWWLGGGQA